MHIKAEPRDQYTILHLRGEFDTYYCPMLQKEIDALISAGVVHVALNLRLVKFINSTALGAIIKASKVLKAAGGKLVISRPSSFCRDIMEKVGLERVVTLYDSDEEAGAGLFEAASQQPARGAEPPEEDESALLFTPADPARVEHFIPAEKRSRSKNPVHGHSFGANWNGVGRMSSLDGEGMRFTWSGGSTGLNPFEMAQFLAIGTELKVKFRLPLLQKGHCEAVVTVTDVSERESSVKIGTTFKEIDDETAQAVEQYAVDMAFLKKELKKATDA